MNNFLEIKSLRAWYGASQALFDVNLEIKEGEIVALLGRNGMGKSTTIKSICGLINNFQGEINLSNISLLGMPSYKIAQLGIGLVPEGRRAFSNLTVLENLIATSVEGEWTLEKVFELFPKLEERKLQGAFSLSGGEQQMLVIGRALMTNPRLLILDEATNHLDEENEKIIFKSLKKLRDELSLIVISHRSSSLKDLDQYISLENGNIKIEKNLNSLTDKIIQET